MDGLDALDHHENSLLDWHSSDLNARMPFTLHIYFVQEKENCRAGQRLKRFRSNEKKNGRPSRNEQMGPRKEIARKTICLYTVHEDPTCYASIPPFKCPIPHHLIRIHHPPRARWLKGLGKIHGVFIGETLCEPVVMGTKIEI